MISLSKQAKLKSEIKISIYVCMNIHKISKYIYYCEKRSKSERERKGKNLRTIDWIKRMFIKMMLSPESLMFSISPFHLFKPISFASSSSSTTNNIYRYFCMCLCVCVCMYLMYEKGKRKLTKIEWKRIYMCIKFLLLSYHGNWKFDKYYYRQYVKRIAYNPFKKEILETSTLTHEKQICMNNTFSHQCHQWNSFLNFFFSFLLNSFYSKQKILIKIDSYLMVCLIFCPQTYSFLSYILAFSQYTKVKG